MRLQNELQSKEKESKLLAMRLREQTSMFRSSPKRQIKSAHKYKSTEDSKRREIKEQYSFLLGRLDQNRKSRQSIKTVRNMTQLKQSEGLPSLVEDGSVRRVGLSRNFNQNQADYHSYQIPEKEKD